MSEAVRFGVSISPELIEQFDELLTRRGYTNRSEAIRDLIRKELVEQEEIEGKEMVGTLTIIYDHHVRELSEELIRFQHDHHMHVLSSLHIHLDHNNCLEVIVVRGGGPKIKHLADRILATKGVKHGRMVITSTGGELPK
ncbi:MAG TPA: nickel-responsive transcriptional regulator NikR [bacterium]|nr:nickel-responsive transcriptional regulator NikR [bacterium]HQO34895.1 nickel-responsive transcriptional regulator NikR [bacterium]HQP98416.1 nickel-responsive transcriptional regulator NikR [bacterium]